MIIMSLILAALFPDYIFKHVKAGIPVLLCLHHKIHNNTRNDVELNFHAVVYHACLQYDKSLRMLNKMILCVKSKLIVISSSNPSYLFFT